MSASLFSGSWYRVAELVPRLRSHARIHRVVYRGDRWYLLQDATTGRFHRFSPAAHELIGLMDGRRRLREIWRMAGERLGDALPTQDETIRLLGQLYHANALVTDASPDVLELVSRGARTRSRERWQRWQSPFALRFGLLDPDRFLDATLPFVRPLLGRIGAAVWLAALVSALLLVARHWPTLSHGVADRVLATENLALLWVAFPLVKVLHELGHAFAVKHWGGEVHEMGIMLLVGVPVPYVDASASSAFPSRWQRVAVGAAGIVVELFVAALATFVWVSAEPGALRALAFNVMVIAGVSSLLFNGNPFLRFDAYYVLSDWLEIPNLGSRANEYWGYWLRRHAFGDADARSPATSGREALWLAVYAVLAFAMRLMVTLSIALFVATRFFVVGVLLAAWSVGQFLLLPLLRRVRFLIGDPQLDGHRGRAWLASGAAIAFVALLFAVPVPSWTRAQGVVWAPEGAQVRAQTAGEVDALLAPPGARVEAGAPLFALRDPELSFERRAAAAALRALEARLADERTRDRVQASITRQALGHARARLARSEQRLASLVVRSPRAGRFLVDHPEDWPGRFVRRGELLGFVVDPDPLIVRVAVPAESVDLVRNHTQRIDVRLAERIAQPLQARPGTEVPGATDVLPSLALAVEGGGEIALGPESSPDGGPRAFRSFFLYDLEVDLARAGQPPPAGVGGRVYVRFAHEPEPIAAQGYRALRRVFLSRFRV